MPILIVNVSGPYGVGKDSVLDGLSRAYPEATVRLSTVTTRAVDNTADPSYRHVSDEELNKLVRLNPDVWVVTEQMDGSIRYGTSIAEAERKFELGQVSLHSIYAGPSGAGVLRSILGPRLLSIGLLPPGESERGQLQELERRLRIRAREDEHALSLRLAGQMPKLRYVRENPTVHWKGESYCVFDAVLENKDLQQTIRSAVQLFYGRCVKPLWNHPRPSDSAIRFLNLVSAYVGGGYFDVEKVLELGTRIEVVRSPVDGMLNNSTHVVSDLYSELHSRTADSLVVGIYRRGSREVAVEVPTITRLLDFEEQVAESRLEPVAFYSLPRTERANALSE
jgi:guanylate kinase